MTDDTNRASTAAASTGTAKLKPRIIAVASALGGMIVGSIVGIAVQVGVESTGVLGPGVESLIAEQEANFAGINERLDALQSATSDPELRVHISELRNLLERQNELGSQASTELRYLGERVATLGEQQLADSGFVGGADFWLQNGESVNVGDESQVFALIRYYGTNQRADVNLSGERMRLAVGDSMTVPGNDCTIFFKQGVRRADGRIGFDISCG